MSATHRKIAAAVLLLLGVGLWWAQDGFHHIARSWVSITVQLTAAGAVMAAYLLIPSLRLRIDAGVTRIRRPSARALRVATVGIFVGSCIYLYQAAYRSGSLEFPFNHDEYMFLTQARIMSTGRLWMPRHPIADFFATFHLLVEPVYCGIQFPGTSLLYVPTIWLNLPYWTLSVLISGGIIALVYRLVTEVMDGLFGAVAVLWMLALSRFARAAGEVFSQSPLLLLVLLAVWIWLRWRRSHGWPLALAIGALGGLAAITRPADAVAWFAPLGLAILLDLRRQTKARSAITLGSLVLGGIPFILLQLLFNYGVTGTLSRTPGSYYNQTQFPGASFVFGFHPVPANASAHSHLLQQQVFYREFMLPFLHRHTPHNLPATFWNVRLPMIFESTLPMHLFLIVLPIGLLAVREPARWVLAAPAVLLVLIYTLFPSFIHRYALPLIPGVLITTLSGIQMLGQIRPGREQALTVALLLGVSVLAVSMLPEFNSHTRITRRPLPTLKASMLDLPKIVEQPAVVLFRFRDGDDVFQEPVYNLETAWPDDAPIVRAHDLGGARNLEIVEYYAERQPRRNFYLFDRQKHELYPLGRADVLLRKLTGSGPATAPAAAHR